jgi:hypothetical protein
MLLIESPAGDGQIYFDQGSPIHAQTLNWSGEEAFNTMLAFKEGLFRFDQRHVPVKANMQQGKGQELLMEGVRLSDEMKEAQRRLPPLETVLVPEEKGGKMEKDLALVVAAFQGGATITGAFERLDIPPYRFFPLVDAAISGGFLGWGNDTGKKAELLRRIKAALEKL